MTDSRGCEHEGTKVETASNRLNGVADPEGATILYFKTPREYILYVIRIDRTRPETHPIYTVVCVRIVFCMNTEIDIIIVFCTSKHRVNTFYSLSVLIGRVPGRTQSIR